MVNLFFQNFRRSCSSRYTVLHPIKEEKYRIVVNLLVAILILFWLNVLTVRGKIVSVNRGNIEIYCIAPRFLMMRWALAVLGRRNEQWVLNIGPLHLEEKHLQFVRNVFSNLSNSTLFCICCICDLDLAHGWTLQRYPGSEVVPPSHRWENVSSWGFGLDVIVEGKS